MEEIDGSRLTLAHVACFVIVTELQSLIDACGSTAGNCSSKKTLKTQDNPIVESCLRNTDHSYHETNSTILVYKNMLVEGLGAQEASYWATGSRKCQRISFHLKGGSCAGSAAQSSDVTGGANWACAVNVWQDTKLHLTQENNQFGVSQEKGNRKNKNDSFCSVERQRWVWGFSA